MLKGFYKEVSIRNQFCAEFKGFSKILVQISGNKKALKGKGN